MMSRTLYRCPQPGCNQTSTRRWNMNVHIKRRHRYSENLIPVAMGSSLTRGGFSTLPYDYGHKANLHHTTPLNTDLSQKKAEETEDRITEKFQQITELLRLMTVFQGLSTKDSITTMIQSQIIALVVSNALQRKQPTYRKYTTPVNNTKLPEAYRISVCDKCLKWYKLGGVSYPIEFEGLTKPIHGCDHGGLVGESDHVHPQNKKSPEQIQLEGMLTEVVFLRIGQGDAYLKVKLIRAQFFTEEIRREIELPPDRSLIEEKDCIEVGSLSKEDKAHWSWRAIKQCSDSDKIKLTREDLKDFLSIARSTFAVFRADVSGSLKKQYFLMYLSI
ncbi:MAG: hypothetical protein WA941_20285 [Nitrososphaeraceae archaeon]